MPTSNRARRSRRAAGATAGCVGLGVLGLLAACAAHPELGGPMPVRNQHPAQLAVLHLDPTGAAPLPAGGLRLRLDNAYSSLFLSGSGRGNALLMDGEILRTALGATLGLGRDIEVAVELPYAHATGGALDGFLIDWHSLWGLPDQGRSAAPRGRFLVGASTPRGPVWSVDEADFAPLDLPVELRWAFAPVGPDRSLGGAVRAAVELPTGDEDRGFGSGRPELALGLVGELRRGPWSFTAQVQHAFAATPALARQAGFDYADVTSGGVGVELAAADGLSLLVQTELESSTLRRLAFARAADPQWLLWTGLRARLGNGLHLEVALGEDLSPYVAPDVTGWLALVWGSDGR